MQQIPCYEVKPVYKPIQLEVEVPGSKSITNRAFLLACMAKGETVLSNVLFSDDTRNFMNCVKDLGYSIIIEEECKRVRIKGGKPIPDSEIYVGSAGTGARFLTAMLAAFPGKYTVKASEQMQARPMKPLFDSLRRLGVVITFLEKENHLPVVLEGGQSRGGKVLLESSNSSQFLSALLMTGNLYEDGLMIRVAGKEVARSYIDMTLHMIAQFDGAVHQKSADCYAADAANTYGGRSYKIEPDVSGACYFYAMAVLTGGSILVKNVYKDCMQGDIHFLDLLEKMGAKIIETEEGILVKGPENGIYPGIDVDMNDCSDQTMTLAALAPFAQSPTIIRNISHIRFQESDRIQVIMTELGRMGIKCEEIDEGIKIYPGVPKPSLIETYNDHRMAMAFALIGLRAKGIKIANPACVSKTFENYFELFQMCQ